MRQFKIVIAGPPSAGKTTAIQTLCGANALGTEATATGGDYGPDKSTITVALDYGVLPLGEHDRLHLYGTPGQERFDFMWEILSRGCLGVALLIDNRAPDPLADLRRFLDAFPQARDGGALVVGITHVDEAPSPPLSAYREALASLPHDPPVFEVDARHAADVSLLLMTLLYDIDHELLHPG